MAPWQPFDKYQLTDPTFDPSTWIRQYNRFQKPSYRVTDPRLIRHPLNTIIKHHLIRHSLTTFLSTMSDGSDLWSVTPWQLFKTRIRHSDNFFQTPGSNIWSVTPWQLSSTTQEWRIRPLIRHSCLCGLQNWFLSFLGCKLVIDFKPLRVTDQTSDPSLTGVWKKLPTSDGSEVWSVTP